MRETLLPGEKPQRAGNAPSPSWPRHVHQPGAHRCWQHPNTARGISGLTSHIHAAALTSHHPTNASSGQDQGVTSQLSFASLPPLPPSSWCSPWGPPGACLPDRHGYSLSTRNCPVDRHLRRPFAFSPALKTLTPFCITISCQRKGAVLPDPSSTATASKPWPGSKAGAAQTPWDVFVLPVLTFQSSQRKDAKGSGFP